ncbi:MAG TPA: hypothetical protein VET27_22590 [Mycobacterium sp.]|nr:hypothetical protein [Mycobacterium sp.]
MRYKDAPAKKRLQSAIALTVVFWVLLVGGEAALPWSEGSEDHTPHTVTTGLVDEFAVVVDHPHIQAWSAVSPDTFATGVLPRAATLLIVLGLAVAGAWMYRDHGVRVTVCGPPPGQASTPSGRQLLTRLCIARR